MEVLAGFLIAAAIGITGVGGGVVTAPALILFFHLPPEQSVGTALLFSAAVKVNALVVYLIRRQVNWRVLGWLLAGGVPGAILGSLLLSRVVSLGSTAVVLGVVGATVALTALYSLLRRPAAIGTPVDRLSRLPWFSFPIGLEVGFSSAGAGALGSVLLLRCTSLAPVMVVGTDLVFGMLLSACGGGVHLAAGHLDRGTLIKLLIGGLVGAPLGAACGSWIPARTLRTAILLWAALMGVLLLVKGFA